MPACPAIALLTVGMICTAPVERVVDGDTAYMVFGGVVSHSVRIVGIDTPERGEAGFHEATEAARATFQGKTVTLTIGGAKGRRKDRSCRGHAVLDRYKRVLARVEGWPAVIAEWDQGAWCWRR